MSSYVASSNKWERHSQCDLLFFSRAGSGEVRRGLKGSGVRKSGCLFPLAPSSSHSGISGLELFVYLGGVYKAYFAPGMDEAFVIRPQFKV